MLLLPEPFADRNREQLRLGNGLVDLVRAAAHSAELSQAYGRTVPAFDALVHAEAIEQRL